MASSDKQQRSDTPTHCSDTHTSKPDPDPLWNPRFVPQCPFSPFLHEVHPYAPALWTIDQCMSNAFCEGRLPFDILSMMRNILNAPAAYVLPLLYADIAHDARHSAMVGHRLELEVQAFHEAAKLEADGVNDLEVAVASFTPRCRHDALVKTFVLAIVGAFWRSLAQARYTFASCNLPKPR